MTRGTFFLVFLWSMTPGVCLASQPASPRDISVAGQSEGVFEKQIETLSVRQHQVNTDMSERIRQLEEQRPELAFQFKNQIKQLRAAQKRMASAAASLQTQDLEGAFKQQTQFFQEATYIFVEGVNYFRDEEEKQAMPLGTFLDRQGDQVHYPKEKKMTLGQKPFFDAEKFKPAEVLTNAYREIEDSDSNKQSHLEVPELGKPKIFGEKPDSEPLKSSPGAEEGSQGKGGMRSKTAAARKPASGALSPNGSGLNEMKTRPFDEDVLKSSRSEVADDLNAKNAEVKAGGGGAGAGAGAGAGGGDGGMLPNGDGGVPDGKGAALLLKKNSNGIHAGSAGVGQAAKGSLPGSTDALRVNSQATSRGSSRAEGPVGTAPQEAANKSVSGMNGANSIQSASAGASQQGQVPRGSLGGSFRQVEKAAQLAKADRDENPAGAGTTLSDTQVVLANPIGRFSSGQGEAAGLGARALDEGPLDQAMAASQVPQQEGQNAGTIQGLQDAVITTGELGVEDAAAGADNPSVPGGDGDEIGHFKQSSEHVGSALEEEAKKAIMRSQILESRGVSDGHEQVDGGSSSAQGSSETAQEAANSFLDQQAATEKGLSSSLAREDTGTSADSQTDDGGHAPLAGEPLRKNGIADLPDDADNAAVTGMSKAALAKDQTAGVAGGLGEAQTKKLAGSSIQNKKKTQNLLRTELRTSGDSQGPEHRGLALVGEKKGETPLLRKSELVAEADGSIGTVDGQSGSGFQGVSDAAGTGFQRVPPSKTQPFEKKMNNGLPLADSALGQEDKTSMPQTLKTEQSPVQPKDEQAREANNVAAIREWLLQERLLIQELKKFKPVKQMNNPNPPWEFYLLRQKQILNQIRQLRRRIEFYGTQDEYFMELHKVSKIANRLLELLNAGEFTEYKISGTSLDDLLEDIRLTETVLPTADGKVYEEISLPEQRVPDLYKPVISRYFERLSRQ